MESSPANFGVVLVTVASLQEGKAIAFDLIDHELAACVNIMAISSIYRWQSKINQDQEYQLIIKTNLDQFDELTERIELLHSYDVPEIIALPIVAGAKPYLEWLGASLQR